MFAFLLANGAPAPYPQPASPLAEWAVWGAGMSLAVLLSGWALLGRNRPAWDTRVGVALLLALVLGAAATVFALSRNHERETERSWKEHQQREQEGRERLEPIAAPR